MPAHVRVGGRVEEVKKRRWSHGLWYEGPAELKQKMDRLADPLAAPFTGARSVGSSNSNAPRPAGRLKENPLVLVRTVASRQVVIAASAEARRVGIALGMTLAQARAICAHLEHAEHDGLADARALEALGRWLVRFTPVVAVEGSEGFFLDITGCQQLFGGDGVIAGRIEAAMERLGITCRIAVAPTPAAAWALTWDGGRERIIVTDEAELPRLLAEVPVRMLRIDAEAVAMLEHLGLCTIGRLMNVPRELLPARFGSRLLQRVDEALGQRREVLAPLPPEATVEARIDFDGVVDGLEALWEVLRNLLDEVMTKLRRGGWGARQVELRLLRPRGAMIRKDVTLSKATRNAASLFNLLRCAMETVGTAYPAPYPVPKGRHFSAQGNALGFRDRVSNPALKGRHNPSSPCAAPSGLGHRSQLTQACARGASLRPGLKNAAPLGLGKNTARRMEPYVEEGFTGMAIIVVSREVLHDEQSLLAESEDRIDDDALSELVARLRLRLGDPAVAAVELAESYVPEKAFRRPAVGARVLDSAKIAKTPRSPRRERSEVGAEHRTSNIQHRTSNGDDPTSMFDVGCSMLDVHSPSSWRSWRLGGLGAISARPLHLLPTPVEIRVIAAPSTVPEGRPVSITWAGGTVERLSQATGPERIAGRWWEWREGHGKTRDYFEIETETARRLWIFRVLETGGWYVHGEYE